VPVLPFTAINYVAGMSSVRFRDFVIGTAVGIVPGALAYAAVGAFGLGLGRWPLAISAVALVAVVPPRSWRVPYAATRLSAAFS
jgi:uncharacterized membrane protein YdjX (TVP38/TMEM64 family)